MSSSHLPEILAAQFASLGVFFFHLFVRGFILSGVVQLLWSTHGVCRALLLSWAVLMPFGCRRKQYKLTVPAWLHTLVTLDKVWVATAKFV